MSKLTWIACTNKKILVVEIAMFGIKTNNRKRFKNNKLRVHVM